MSVLEIQQALKAAGFDPGGLDGKMGPNTRAAIKAFQQAHGLTVDGIVGPQTTSALQGGAGGGGGAPATSTSQQVTTQVEGEYPQFGWLINDPEVGPILRNAWEQGLPPAQLAAQVQNTNWYRSRSDGERSFLALAATDPAEATRRLNDYDQIQQVLAYGASYGVHYSFDAAKSMYGAVVNGTQTADIMRQAIRDSAKGLYPYLSEQIDKGISVDAIFDPIRNAATQVLGVNPATVTLDNSKWSSLLQQPDGKGGFRMPTMQEVQKRLRDDPVFGFDSSQNGRDSAFEGVQGLAQSFGFQP